MYPLAVACVIIAVSSLPLLFIAQSCEKEYQKEVVVDQTTNHNDFSYWVSNLAYPFIALQGVGLAIMLNTATSIISDVVGKDSANAAFVTGAYSFFDKMANGGLLYWMVESYAEDGPMLAWFIAISPIICAILAFVFTYIGQALYSDKLAKITGVRK